MSWLKLAERPEFHFRLHPHCLRHASGYRLANERRATRDIQGYLGHKDMRHTIGYTELDRTRFEASSRAKGYRDYEL
jgi:type 1 fimbriae regulatory protein FimB/type 1 fimbriae regulatory protein FimE